MFAAAGEETFFASIDLTLSIPDDPILTASDELVYTPDDILLVVLLLALMIKYQILMKYCVTVRSLRMKS